VTEHISPTPNPSPAARGEGDVARLIYNIIQSVRARHPDRPALIGVSGAQGCGKTYVCHLLEAANRPRFAHFSLDDVYLTKAKRLQNAATWAEFFNERGAFRDLYPSRSEREEIARATEPLFVVRGPPGTHDLGLAGGVIARLGTEAVTRLPRFDKVIDDRAAEETWPLFQGPAQAILIDGWCLGALPPEYGAPINDVERQDVAGFWRKQSELALEKNYTNFFASFDAIVYLRAPNWEIVRKWRGQQEEQTLGRKLTAEEETKLDRFLMFYERITKSMMAGAHCATHVVQLDETRRVI